MLNNIVMYFIAFICILGFVQSYPTGSIEHFETSDTPAVTLSSDDEFSSEAVFEFSTLQPPKYSWSHEETSEQPEVSSIDINLADDLFNSSNGGSPTPLNYSPNPNESDRRGRYLSNQNSSTSFAEETNTRSYYSLFRLLSLFNRNSTHILTSTLKPNVKTTTENIEENYSLQDMSSEPSSHVDNLSFVSTTNMVHSTTEAITHNIEDTSIVTDLDIESSSVPTIDHKISTHFYSTTVSNQRPITLDTKISSSDSDNLFTTSDIVQVSTENVEISSTSSPIIVSTSSVDEHLVLRGNNELITHSSSGMFDNFETSTEFFSESDQTMSERYFDKTKDAVTEESYDGNETFSQYETYNETLVPDFVPSVSSTTVVAVTEVEELMTSPETHVQFTTPVNRNKDHQNVSYEDNTSLPPREYDNTISFNSIETTPRLQVVKSTVQNNVELETHHNSSDDNVSGFSTFFSTTESFGLTTEQADNHADVTVPIIAGGVAMLVLILVSLAIWLQGRRKRSNRRLRLRDRLVNTTKPKTTGAADLPRFMVAMKQFPDHEVL